MDFTARDCTTVPGSVQWDCLEPMAIIMTGSFGFAKKNPFFVFSPLNSVPIRPCRAEWDQNPPSIFESYSGLKSAANGGTPFLFWSPDNPMVAGVQGRLIPRSGQVKFKLGMI